MAGAGQLCRSWKPYVPVWVSLTFVATVSLYVSIYNLFVSLLNILGRMR